MAHVRVACGQEVESRLEQEERRKAEQMEKELARQLTTRLARARGARLSREHSDEEAPAAAPLARTPSRGSSYTGLLGSPRETFRSEASLAAAAGMLAAADLERGPSAAEDVEAGQAAPPTPHSPTNRNLGV